MERMADSATANSSVTIDVLRRPDFDRAREDWDSFTRSYGYPGYFHQLAWGSVLHDALGHEPYFLIARRDHLVTGLLPLTLVRSLLFGRFLVSLPYLNTAGVLSNCPESARRLIDRAVELADELQVKHLELRHEREIEHPSLTERMTTKVHMRLALPETPESLMASFKSKLRSQVKKSLANGQTVTWGREELLGDFYAVFSRNMRDLGTPVYPRQLFQSMLRSFPTEAELCIVYQERQPAAAALLVHGPGTTQVPSASTLREFNPTNANMRLYWHLLERSVLRGQSTFDFGRSSAESGPYKFKEQWGARPDPAIWQTYRRAGTSNELRPDNSKFQTLIRVWTMLPMPAANFLGPWIVRGIP